MSRAAPTGGDLADILAAGLICHLGVVVDGYPMVVPTVYGAGRRRLYLHGSVASRSLVAAPQATICVTVTHVDGLVLARSVFEHAVNYRSAMIYGTPRLVTDREEKLAGLRALTEHIAPGQWDYARRPNKKELAKTSLLALSLAEASVKIRSGPPDDGDSPDAALPVWAACCRWPPPGRTRTPTRCCPRGSRCPRTSPPWPAAPWGDRSRRAPDRTWRQLTSPRAASRAWAAPRRPAAPSARAGRTAP